MASRAFRNNNPGNLRYAGQAGTTGQDAEGFAIFASAQDGFNALLRQLTLDANRGQTLSSFINAYAPPSENNTGNYLDYLISKTGAAADTLLSDIDLNVLSNAIAHFEGYYV